MSCCYLVDAAEAALTRVPGVLSFSDMRMRWVGHEVHAEATIEVAHSQTLAAADAIAHRTEQSLLDAVPRLTRAIVRVRPQAPETR